jgi:hypothetical protein
LEALRDNSGLTRFCEPTIPDCVFEIDEKTRLNALVSLVDENAPLAKQRLKPLQDNVNDRVEQRMGRSEQFGLRLAIDQSLFERHPCIAIKDRIAASDQAIAFLQDAGHARNFKSAFLALGNASSK